MKDNRYQDDYIEVNIKDLFWSVLSHWRLFLVALLIGCLVFGAYRAYKDFRVLSNASEVEKREKAYKEELEDYKRQKAQLEIDLKSLQDQQKNQQYYQDNALMLQMDQYNVWFVSSSYFMEVSQQDDMDKEWVLSYAQTLIRRYQAALGQLDLNEIIATAEKPELTAANPAGTTLKLLETSTDDKVSVLYVTVRANSEEQAMKIYEAVEKTLRAQETALSDSDGRYQLSKISEKTYVDVDAEIGKVQTSFQNSVKTVLDSIMAKEKSLAELREPSNSTPTKRSTIKNTIKYSIIGSLAGLFGAAFVIMVCTVFQDRLKSTEEAEKRYRIPILGTANEMKKKKTKLDKFFAKRLGFNYNDSAEVAIRYTASSIRFQLKNASRMLLIGNCGIEKLNMLREQLTSHLEGVEIAAVGNVNEDAAAIDALCSETAVVCVEEWMKTQHKEIRRELRTIEDSGNRVLGFVTFL